jgi:hypothetical protein
MLEAVCLRYNCTDFGTEYIYLVFLPRFWYGHIFAPFVNYVMCHHLSILPSPIEINSKICALNEGHSNTFCKRPLQVDIVFCQIIIKLYVPIPRHNEGILMIAPHTAFKALQQGLFVYGV